MESAPIQCQWNFDETRRNPNRKRKLITIVSILHCKGKLLHARESVCEFSTSERKTQIYKNKLQIGEINVNFLKKTKENKISVQRVEKSAEKKIKVDLKVR